MKRDRGEFRNWSAGSTGGVSAAGFAFNLDYARLPLNEPEFLRNFQTVDGNRASSATASDAQLASFSLMARIRIPSPFAMPNIALASAGSRRCRV